MYEDNSVNPVLGAAATISIDRYRPIGIIGKKKKNFNPFHKQHVLPRTCMPGLYRWVISMVIGGGMKENKQPQALNVA